MGNSCFSKWAKIIRVAISANTMPMAIEKATICFSKASENGEDSQANEAADRHTKGESCNKAIEKAFLPLQTLYTRARHTGI